MKDFVFTPEISAAAPALRVAVVEADIVNGETTDALWAEISRAAALLAGTPMEAVNKRPAIAATRAAYKAAGKEPNRYRPSAEALCRRCVKGLELYRSLAVIDLINLLSIQSGHSIGGFDADKIEGGLLTLGIGRDGEPYEAIHRGQFNIAGMPVIRDAVGGIGTPTSDNDRTKLSADTRHLLMTVNMYDGGGTDAECESFFDEMRRLLVRYSSAENIEIKIFNAK
ncbi:MAG: phenylalanine--tRNA ligase beta subunit-related protein [Bacteroidales bacterium]|nr:phenylalanine--tRNA ligase beta subunit-related protein [Bacteroidales bacterium]